MHQTDLLTNIGLAIVTATGFGLLAKSLRQPLLLAYLAAGVVLGPEMGLGWIEDKDAIHTISEIGLILLLFIIGLEIDLKKLLASGRTLVVSGVVQFVICVVLGLGFALAFGFAFGQGSFDALYLAVAMSLGSTMIVVKLLYDKFELSSLPGRITLGILVFQDIWAILFLAVQPNLLNPEVLVLALSFAQGAGLVILSLLASRYVLPKVFSFVAKVPELLLVTAVSWCFLVSGVAGAVGLSREMGALIAGVSLSTFPYNVDVIAKVINIRDFFVILFFVGLGLQIPAPSLELVALAGAASLFLVASRFLSIFPPLYLMKNGLRASLIPSINLCQMSEFSLVIVSLGYGMGHVSSQTVGVLTFVFVITSVLSTYMINANHQVQEVLAGALKKAGLPDLGRNVEEGAAHSKHKSVVFLGFFRETSSILYELEKLAGEEDADWVRDEVLVVDYNPLVYRRLNDKGVTCVYGDISSMDTLQHAHIESAALVISSIGDTILRGTTNARLLKAVRRLCPEAEVMVTANTIQKACDLYSAGASFVFIPRVHSAAHIARLIINSRREPLKVAGERESEGLRNREEVLG
jgi:Kef-type K+ transport system membrane component KefB